MLVRREEISGLAYNRYVRYYFVLVTIFFKIEGLLKGYVCGKLEALSYLCYLLEGICLISKSLAAIIEDSSDYICLRSDIRCGVY